MHLSAGVSYEQDAQNSSSLRLGLYFNDGWGIHWPCQGMRAIYVHWALSNWPPCICHTLINCDAT